MSKIYEDFLKYRDANGLNHLHTDGEKGHTSQNGQLFTMEYLICLLNSPESEHSEREAEVRRLIPAFRALELFPGTALRNVESREGNSMDNMIPHLIFDYLYDGGEFCKRFRKHGKETPFQGIDWEQGADRNALIFPIAWAINGFKAPKDFWNNTKPGWFSVWGWYGRSPALMAKAKWLAGEKLNFFDKAAIMVGQFLGCLKPVGDTDARKLPYVNWFFLKEQGKVWELGYKLWCYITEKQYGPEGMRAVYSIYYGDVNHPIRKYSLPFIK